MTKGSTADIDLMRRLARAKITNTRVEYTNSEAVGAGEVVHSPGVNPPFAHGGGEGSVIHLADQVPGLQLAWVHCLMLRDGKQVPEPFSFVTRTASTELIEAVNSYIADPTQPYEGGPGTNIACHRIPDTLPLWSFAWPLKNHRIRSPRCQFRTTRGTATSRPN